MSIRKMTLGGLVAGLFGLTLTAGLCPDPGGEPCTSEADCTTEEHCHPTLKVCVPNCKMVEGACDSEPGTTCSETDIIEPINALSFNGICVCDPEASDCPSGEGCNPLDRTCDVPCEGDADCDVYEDTRTCRDQGGMFCLLDENDCRGNPDVCTGTDVCDPATGECVAPCTAGSCAAGSYCDDARFMGSGTCITNPSACNNDDCYDDVTGLCDTEAGAETENLCMDPDSVTNNCGAAGMRGTDGPVMVVDAPADDIWAADASEDSGECINNGNNLMAVFFTVYDAQADWGAAFGDTQWDDSGWSNVYDASWSHDGGDFLLVYMCFQSSGAQTRAFHHTDLGGNASNTVCVDYSI